MEYRAYFINEYFNDIRYDELMKIHTSFKVGGPADVLVIAKSEEEIINAIKICKDNNLPCFVMGNGTNLLVTDKGIRGVVIKINEGFDKVEVVEDTIRAQAG